MGAASDLAQVLRLYWPLLLGNVVEWYEFAVYGYLEPYLEVNFFQGSAVATWLGFAVTFLARPLGGVVLGVLGDVFGRRTAVNISIVGMIIGTCGQGLLPTYTSGSDALGLVGVIFLMFLRFLQGISAAGEIGGIATYLTEVAPCETLGRSLALISITSNLGFLSAKAMVFLLDSLLGQGAMEGWGWRLPFVLALLPGLVAVWGRRGLPESEEFLEQRSRSEQVAAGSGSSDSQGLPSELDLERPEEVAAREDPTTTEDDASGPRVASKRSGIGKILRAHGCNVLIGMFAMASLAIFTYGGGVWVQSYLMKRGLDANGRMLADLCMRGLSILLALPVGLLADVQGVGWVTFVGASLLAVAGFPLFAVLSAHPTSLAAALGVCGVGYGVLGAIVATVPFYFVTELFPTAVRSAGVGVAYNLGLSIFGGLAPVVAQASLDVSPRGPGFLLSVGGAITACTVAVGLCLQQCGLVQLAHVRPQPYFAPCDPRTKETAGSPASASLDDVSEDSVSG